MSIFYFFGMEEKDASKEKFTKYKLISKTSVRL